MSQMKKYSVLLLYPEEDNEGGTETYYTFVGAASVELAIEAARLEACATNDWDADRGKDFYPLLTLEGWHVGL